MEVAVLVLVFVLVRAVECYIFIKKVSKICYQYDWKHVDANANLVLDIIKKDYYLTNTWSAYNFLYLQGPNPITMFFSLKPMKLESIYNKEAINRLKKYEII
jgi:hypothetical protein